MSNKYNDKVNVRGESVLGLELVKLIKVRKHRRETGISQVRWNDQR